MNCGKEKILFTEIVVSYTLVVTQAHPYLSHQPTNLPFPFNSMLFHYLLPLLIASCLHTTSSHRNRENGEDREGKGGREGRK